MRLEVVTIIMEKEGLQRVLDFLKNEGITVDVLVTDRHKQINKWIRENHPSVNHYYDIWHVAKCLSGDPINTCYGLVLMYLQKIMFVHLVVYNYSVN